MACPQSSANGEGTAPSSATEGNGGAGGAHTLRQMDRLPTGPLSRQAIVSAAVGLMDSEGLERVSTRRLAAVLGVSPMALYRHVESKDDLLEAVVEALLERIPLTSERSWPDVLRALATGLREMFGEHPAALELFLRRPVTSVTARRRLRLALDALVAEGFDEDDACRAYAAVHSYTLGFSALEAARSRYQPTVGSEDGPPDDDRLANAIRAFVSDGQFEHGLDAMLAGMGLERHAEPQS